MLGSGLMTDPLGSSKDRQARNADATSAWLVARRNGDGPRVWWAYARRSSVPERICPTRRAQT